MERKNGTTQGIKKVVAVLALMAAMASTGCGENALLNPTADQICMLHGTCATPSGSTANAQQRVGHGATEHPR